MYTVCAVIFVLYTQKWNITHPFLFNTVVAFKGIVSGDFEWLQTVLMKRLCVPDVPLEVYSFLSLLLHLVL